MLPNESIEGLTVWLMGAGGTPSEKSIRVDYNADGEPFGTLACALAILSYLAPSCIVPGYLMRLDHDLNKPSVLLWLEPSKALPK
jgi:hypothetical protein